MITDPEPTQEERAELARSSKRTAILLVCVGVLIAFTGIVGLVRGTISSWMGYLETIFGVLFIVGSWKPYKAYLKYKDGS